MSNSLEKSAVRLTFWFGGIGLVGLKGFAYLATGSILVRTSMFESLGDVISSAIMAVTQAKMEDTRDVGQYPVGKGRFQAIGVLFFCAFMCSSMSNMAIDSFQAILGEGGGENPAEDAMRKLFAERPMLRLATGGNVDATVSQYAADGDEDGGSGDMLSLTLLFVCVVVKVFLYCYCRAVSRKSPSAIVDAVGDDHRNDSISVSIVIGSLSLISFANRQGWDSPWLAKIDPTVSFLLSLWIVYGWIQNTLEQVKVLSDKRADEEALDVEAVRGAVSDVLKGSTLQVMDAEAYHAGEGYRVAVRLAPGCKSTAGIQEAVSAVDEVVRRVSDEVKMVDISICAPARKPAGDWVQEFGKAVGA